MKPIFEYTKGMRDTQMHYCPGCTHGIFHRLIMEVLDERGDLGNCIAASPVGCSIVALPMLWFLPIRETGIWHPSEPVKSSMPQKGEKNSAPFLSTMPFME